MSQFLNRKKIYVIDEDTKLVYVVHRYSTYYDCDWLDVELRLVCGWDYVDPDNSDVQGWCTADRFTEDVQFESVIQYFFVEGMKEALEANGYTVLEEISPDLQAIIGKHNEA